VLALPFLALFAVLGLVLFGAGLFAFFLPALPIVLLALGVWWLVKRSRTAAATSSM
jgi:uncharacterized membrane protein YfbV (UPF0208 family)